MSLEISIKDHSAGLRSDRATERKKNAEALKTYLNNNAAPALLTENTIKKAGYSWNHLFTDINEFIIKEGEKFDTSRSFDNIKPLCANLLHSAVAGSNKDKAYIKSEKITDSCLFILNSSRLVRAFGDIFMTLLYKHVMPYEYYLSFISPETWKELLETCTSVYCSGQSVVDHFTNLKLILLIMQNAVRYCQFVGPLADLLPKLQKCYTITIKDKKVQETLVEIAVLFLEQLGPEYRMTICEFTETIVPVVTRWYDHNADNKRKVHLFKFLQMTVMIHHPQGRLQSEEGSLAFDWTIWRNQIQNILEIICLEVNFLQKSLDSRFKYQNENPALKLCCSFVQLAASVYYLAINMIESSDDVGPSSKRPRTTFNKYKIFSDLIEALQQNHVPWLKVIYIYISNYGSSLSADDFSKLLNTLESYITNNISNFNWDDYKNIIVFTLKMYQSDVQEDTVIMSLWNTCVRYSASVNSAHETLHCIINTVVDLGVLHDKQIMPLIKLYNEKAMPLTDSSITTLTKLLSKKFCKFNDPGKRFQCFSWLTNGDYVSLNGELIKELLMRLVSKEHVNIPYNPEPDLKSNDLYHILFETVDKCILFTEFEIDLITEKDLQLSGNEYMHFEAEDTIKDNISEFFTKEIEAYLRKIKNEEIKLIELIKLIQIILLYCDMLLKCKIVTNEELLNYKMYKDLKDAMRHMFIFLSDSLKDNIQLSLKTRQITNVQVILNTEYDHFLCEQVRLCIHDNFFHKLEEVINTNTVVDDDTDVLAINDDKTMETNPQTLKFTCIYLLASYCRRKVMYRDEILDMVLNPALYNFSSALETDAAFNCIELINKSAVDAQPIEQIFALLRMMCKDLFRNTKATFRILKQLYKILDRIFCHPSNAMRDNCIIMIKGYLSRCEKLYYPPYVAALIYKCMAKIVTIKKTQNQNSSNDFKDTLLQTINSNALSVRLYSCYLLTKNTTFIECVLEPTFFVDIFAVDISERNEISLKDELANRTATVLHCFHALVSSKQTLTLDVVQCILEMHKVKKLKTVVVLKVLKKIIKMVTSKNLEEYLSKNLLQILQFWFGRNHKIQELPIDFFGTNTLNKFVSKYIHCLVPAELLWCKKGRLDDSEVIRIVNKTNETILQNCFPTITALLLPYIACDKYMTNARRDDNFKETTRNAKYLYQSCRQVLGTEKWSNLFMENIGVLILLSATQIYDSKDVKLKFDVDVAEQTSRCHYSLENFSAMLTYIGETIDGNVMQYLSDKQPLAMSKIIIELWTYVTEENIYEFKTLALHRLIVVFEKMTLDTTSDAFVCNFVSNSLKFAIKQSNCKKEILIYAKALYIVLSKLLPHKMGIIEKSMPEIISTLLIKKEDGYGSDCLTLLNYLLVDMKCCLKESIDLVDGSQALPEYSFCSTKLMFINNLNSFVSKLSHYSFETLCNIKEYLRNNKENIAELYKGLNGIKGFSEECNNSLIHQLMNALIIIAKSSGDSRNVLEACNCLAEIGICDLKTLVMMPPHDTKKISEVNPNQYFAFVVIKCLNDVIFDCNPTVVNQAVKALTSLLKYRDGRAALEYGDVNRDVLQPFAPATGSTTYAKFSINNDLFDKCKNLSTWIPDEETNYLDWLKNLTNTLLDVVSSEQNYILSVHAICNSQPILCQKLLPSLFGLILFYTKEAQVLVIRAMINKFFQYFMDTFNHGYSEESNQSFMKCSKPLLTHNHKLMVQTIIEVVDFVRLQRLHYKKWSNELIETYNYLNLNYKAVAWAANVADKSVSAIYYGELSCISQNNGIPPASPEETSKLDDGETIQKIFQKAFISIGDMDAIDGCGTSHLTDEDERRKHLMLSGHSTDSLLVHDIALSSGSNVESVTYELHYGIAKSLQQSGMYHVAMQYINSLPDNNQLDDIKYDCCSQLGDWSIFVDTADLEIKTKTSNVNLESIIKAFRYACLKDCLTLQINQEHEDKLLLPLQRAKTAVSMLSQKLNMNNCQNVYKVVSKLQLFKEIEDYYSVRCEKSLLPDLLSAWQMNNLPRFKDLKYLEILLSQRSLILEHAFKCHSDLRNDIVNLQLHYAELLLASGKGHISERFVAVAKKLQDFGEVSLVEGQVSWSQGHKDIALSLIRKLTLETSENQTLTATALRQYGNWMVESKFESGREIIDKYLKRSLEVLGPHGHQDTRLKVYYDIAKFADTEYKQVSSYMKSSIFTNKVKCMESMKGTATRFKNSQQSMSKDERKALITNERLSTLDEAEIASTSAEKERFLHLAMRYYLLSLAQGEQNNLSIFRVISLWLENPALQLDENQDGSFEQLLCAVPSRKYLPVLPQLAPRLTTEKKTFADNLNNIISKCATDHPHHTLPILFGLKNSHKDLCIMNINAESGGGPSSVPNEEQRVTAAKDLLNKLRDSEDILASIINQMNIMCDAIIMLANFKVPSPKSIKQNIPGSVPMTKLRNLDSVCVPTITLPIKHDCVYADFVSVASFSDSFDLVGGINCPKKMNCKGSDGKNRTILIKGEDDLRQDAVMQQVFNIVNTLLETNSVTSKYNLVIRTYKDISSSGARAKLQSCYTKSTTEKLTVFLKILKEFRPVFHYFFTEHYSDPVTWYERRQAYTRSVASSSMVGYILGLGDRHVQNILIDKMTAEVIHIDFGIAFDQGKALPTPESVPFRLTQDIIAGFGPSGVEGVFRRSCEKTMQLLRDNQETLLTILEVLLCDPLYSWSITPAQAKRKQNVTSTPRQTNEGGAAAAERALLAVSSKLSGTEGGAARGVRVPGQVARLLRHAADQGNLARLFPGWQPYL